MVICYLLGGKILLPCKHPGHVARDRLDQAEDKISRGHEIKRENIKLNADPQHQCYAEYPAQDGSDTTVFSSSTAAVRLVRPLTISSAMPENVKF